LGAPRTDLRGAGFVNAPPEKIWCWGAKEYFLLGSTYFLLAYWVVINGLTVENGLKSRIVQRCGSNLEPCEAESPGKT
jgi:hypothetical protein